MRLIDITGQRFGRLVVEARGDIKKGHMSWVCRCDCGKSVTVSGYSMRTGHTRSCGCLRVETKAGTRHGGSLKSEYTIWCGIKARCQNPNNRSYPRYGGRGILVCERWQSFENFMADMGARPSLRHSIDRIDNDKGYEPSNCRWAVPTQQARNSRRFSGGHVDSHNKAELVEDVVRLERENTRLLGERLALLDDVERLRKLLGEACAIAAAQVAFHPTAAGRIAAIRKKAGVDE